MSVERKKYPPEKKVEILREHLKNKVPVSEVCEKYGKHERRKSKSIILPVHSVLFLFSG